MESIQQLMAEQQQPAPSMHPGVPNEGPLFVVGLWRSGTSLLYALLNQHPQVALMYEAELPTLRPLFWKGSNSDWLERWQFWNQAPQRHHLELAPLTQDASDLRQACESAYLQFARGKEATVWGEKSPNFFDGLLRLSRTFPKSRFVVIWRHPAAICRSIINAASGNSYFSKSGMTLRALIGCEVLKRQCDLLIANGIPLHQIVYDDLIQNPSASMKAVCAFLNIPYHESMATLEGSDNSAIYEGAHHDRVKGKDKKMAARGADVLDVRTKEKIDRYIRWWRRKFGDEWPPFVKLDAIDGGLPGRFERIADRARYRAFRTFDAITRITYCLVPLGLLRSYRATKRKDQTSAA